MNNTIQGIIPAVSEIISPETFYEEICATERHMLHELLDITSSANPDNRKSTDERLLRCSKRISTIQHQFSEVSSSIPAYLRRQTGDIITGLIAAISAARDRVFPPSRFQFYEDGDAEQEPDLAVTITEDKQIVYTEAADFATITPDVSDCERTLLLISSETTAPTWDWSFCDQYVSCLLKNMTEENQSFEDFKASFTIKHVSWQRNSDLWLANITNSIVIVHVPVVAFRANNFDNVILLTGAIAGSAHIERLNKCMIALNCRQLRIHHAISVYFSIMTKSRPIIEHCNACTFYPYVVRFPGIYEEITNAGLNHSKVTFMETSDVEVISDNVSPFVPNKATTADAYWGCTEDEEKKDIWAQIDDFGWLRAQQSPNWAICPRAIRWMALQSAPTLK